MSDGGESLLEGLYESLLTSALERRLAGLTNLEVQRGAVDEADAPDVLARHIRDVTLRALRQEKDGVRRLALVNRLVDELGAPEDSVATAGQLLALGMPTAPGAVVRAPARAPIDAVVRRCSPHERAWGAGCWPRDPSGVGER